MIIVAKDGSGDFSKISDALKSIENETEENIIFIKNGVYKERIEVKKPNLIFRGESVDETVITYDLGAKEILEDGFKRGTFRTYTVFIDADNFTAENITFVNSAGLGRDVGQALAVYADADNLTFKNCKFLGSQDTLFTGPLPPTVIEPRGFVGPKENAPRINGRHYYKDCFIRGDVDFIFGGATAYFENCEIFSQNLDQEINGYVTAPSTPEGQKYGYVFESCKFTSNCPEKTVYLGRPWRNFAKAVFLNCELGAHIKEEGFHDWNKPDAHETMLFAEYNCYGPGAKGTRASFAKQLTEEEAAEYTKEKVLASK